MIGQTLATYRLVEKLGEGGMGEVYRAVDEMLDRDVALKMLKPELARRQSTVDRFRAEAITLAKLDHPGIARIHGCSVHEDRWFIVMEFVRGETLLGRLARYGRLTWMEAVPIVCQLLDALEYAHRRGVIHRDMKPANVLMSSEGAVKVTDFGIARVLGTERATRTGHIVGTLEYMSPEQVRGEEVDGRADLYAVGILLFELLTGRVPFKGGAEYEVLTQHLQAPIPSVRSQIPDAPAWIDEVLQRALAKAPADRYPSAAAFQVALEGYAASEPAMRVRATRLANAAMDAAIIGTTGALPRATDPQAVSPTLPGPQTAPTVLNPLAPDPFDAPTRLDSGAFAAAAFPAASPAAAGPPALPPPGPLAGPPQVPPPGPPALPPLGPPSVDTAPTRRTRRPGLTWRPLAAIAAVVAVLLVASGVGIVRYLSRDRGAVAQEPPPEAGGPGSVPPFQPAPTAESPAPAAAAPAEPIDTAPTPAPAPLGRAPAAGTSASSRPAPGTTATPDPPPPAADADATAAPAPAPAPAPVVAPAAPRVEAAAVQFDEVALVTLAGDDVEEREIVLRFESDRVVLIDADSETAVRAIPYRSLGDATYARTRRPVLKADRDRAGLIRGVAKGGGLFRRTPHWLTLEGGGAPIMLKVDGDDIDRVVSQIESRTTVKIERVSEK